jgi:glutamate-ammonia-ligase adenylyltransferase
MDRLVQDLEKGTFSRGEANRLSRAGFAEPRRALDTLRRLRELLVSRGGESLGRLLGELAGAPSPDQALSGLGRLHDRAGREVLGRFLDHPRRGLLVTVLGASPFLTDVLIRNPEGLEMTAAGDFLAPVSRAGEVLRHLREDPGRKAPREMSLSVLRRLQRREILCVAARDLSGEVPLEATLEELSAIADGAIGWALECVGRDLFGGVPPSPLGFCVVAMGKLGGRELNYFSDVDLVYVHRDLDPGRTGEAERHRQLAQELTRELSRVTPEGTLYRVDLRLRPDGETGPIVGGVGTHVAYYARRAHGWELLSFLKARPAAGDIEMGERFVEKVRKILLTRAELGSPVREFDRLLARIREGLSEEDQRLNVKLMPGGIREIEFLVQAMQLAHGVSRPEVVLTGTLPALGALRDAGCIAEPEAGMLERAYRFQRTVEHRLQIERARRTHTLPKDREKMKILGRRVAAGPLGDLRPDDYFATLGTHLARVRKLSGTVFRGREPGARDILFLLEPRDPRAVRTLERYGFRDPPAAHRILSELAHGTFPRLEGRETAEALEDVLDPLLGTLAHAPDPQGALENLSRVVLSTHALHATYRLFAGTPDFLRMLCDLAAYSAVHSRALARDIGFLDALVERLQIFDPAAVDSEDRLTPPPRVERAPPGALEESLGRLRAWRSRREMVGLLALGGPVRAADLFPRLVSRVAETGFLHLIRTAARGRDLPPFAVGALGSFADRSLNVTSDLDLIVLLDEAEPEAIEATTRFFQEVVRHAERGLGFRVDFRLRGEGRSAPLVQTLSYYAGYFPGRGQLWERLAFLKFRFLRGSDDLRRRFHETLRGFLFGRPLTRDQVGEIRRYRKGLESLAWNPDWDVKWAPGGQYDLEYLEAAGRLALGIEEPLATEVPERERSEPRPGGGGDGTSDAGNPRLERLVDRGLLSQDDARFLAHARRVYRRVEQISALHEIRRPSGREGLERLGRILTGFRVWDEEPPGNPDAGKESAPAVDGLAATRARVREIFLGFLDRLEESLENSTRQ